MVSFTLRPAAAEEAALQIHFCAALPPTLHGGALLFEWSSRFFVGPIKIIGIVITDDWLL